MKKVYASDVIIGGAVGVGGFYSGLSKGLTILLAMLAVAASIGFAHFLRQWKSGRAPTD